MSRIVYAWELGASYGHVAAFLPLANAFRDAGHEVVFVLKELTHAETLLGQHDFEYLQAPLWLLQLDRLTHPVNYAEMLFKVGYLSLPGVLGLVKAWRTQLHLLRPDLLIVDHGPSPLLASRNAPYKRITYGNGFFVPPQITPMPSIRPEVSLTPAKLLETEARALAVINEAAQKLQLPALNALCNLFDVDANFLSTFPELDHYPQRTGGHYVGPAINLTVGANFTWPEVPGPMVLVFLQAGFTHTDKIIAALATLPVRAVVHSPILEPALIQKYSQPNLLFSTTPLHMGQASREADVAICNAGMGTISAMLLAGTPLLLFPSHQEQFMLASAVMRLGAGMLIVDPGPRPDFQKWIMELITQQRLHSAAAAFQDKYRDFNQTQQLESIVARCEQLLRA